MATFTYRATDDARGTFVIGVLGYDKSTPQRRTFLFGSGSGTLALSGTTPAVVTVVPARQPRG